jgi:hypothetical protein
VTDTGFDDASCWLRHWDPASLATPQPTATPLPNVGLGGRRLGVSADRTGPESVSFTDTPTAAASTAAAAGATPAAAAALAPGDAGSAADGEAVADGRRLGGNAASALACSDSSIESAANVYDCLNLAWQVERSEFNAPVTDFRFRKVHEVC